MTGINETKELLRGVLVFTQLSASLLKDGFQVADLVAGYAALAADPEKKAKLEEALKGIVAVQAEIKDLSLSEGVELLVVVAEELPALLSAFKA